MTWLSLYKVCLTKFQRVTAFHLFWEIRVFNFVIAGFCSYTHYQELSYSGTPTIQCLSIKTSVANSVTFSQHLVIFLDPLGFSQMQLMIIQEAFLLFWYLNLKIINVHQFLLSQSRKERDKEIDKYRSIINFLYSIYWSLCLFTCIQL